MVSIVEQVARGEAPPFVSLDIEQYLQMMRSGILPEGAPIELIDGMLVYKDRGDSRSTQPMVHGPDHILAVKELLAAVTAALAGLPFHSQCQLPIAIPPNRMPEPDVSIVEGTPRDHANEIPPATRTVAVLEVAHSSRTFDRGEKQEIYATANIPIYVVVDLKAGVIEVYSQPIPGDGRYARVESRNPGDEVSFDVAGHAIVFDVDSILP